MAKFILANVEHNEDGFLCFTVGKSVKLYSFLEAKNIVLSNLRKREKELRDLLKIRKEMVGVFRTPWLSRSYSISRDH